MSAAASSSVPLIAFPVREPAHTARISRWVHLVPGLADVAFLLPALLMLRLGGLSFLLADGDTGWHLRTGEWILRNGRVPTTDLFSYTMPNAPWFAWEWLWDVMFGWPHLHFGMPAVLLGSLFLICLVSALVYVFARGISGNPVIAMAVTFIGGVASSVHWLARPHLVSLLFIVLFVMILEQARAGRFGRLWLLPLLTVPWANLHGGFFVGVILAGIFAAGEVCAGLFEPEKIGRRAAWMRNGRAVDRIARRGLRAHPGNVAGRQSKDSLQSVPHPGGVGASQSALSPSPGDDVRNPGALRLPHGAIIALAVIAFVGVSSARIF